MICFILNILYFIFYGYWGWGHLYDDNKVCLRCGKDWNAGTYERIARNAVVCASCGEIIGHENGESWTPIRHKCTRTAKKQYSNGWKRVDIRKQKLTGEP